MKHYQNKGEDVAKIFHMEVREKKRIGSNIFSRVSTRRGGSKYTSPYANLKPKEVRLMSGDVKVFNIYENLMNYNEFVKRPLEQQKAIMTKWREKFPNNEIIKGLGCGKTQYYRKIDELGLKNSYKKRVAVKTGENNSKEFNPNINLDEYKDNIIDIKLFKQISRNERATLLFHYLNTYTVKELSLEWNVTLQYIHNMRNKFKNLIKNGKMKLIEFSNVEEQKHVAITSKEDTDLKYDNIELPEVEPVEEVDEYTLDDVMNTPMKIEEFPKQNPVKFSSVINEMQKENGQSINIQFTKELTPMELIQQIQSLTFLLDHNQKYKIEFKVNN
jgi:hypothetical protein